MGEDKRKGRKSVSVAIPVIPVFRRLRQKDPEFKAILGYSTRFCHHPPKGKKKW